MNDLPSYPLRPARQAHVFGILALLGACQEPNVQKNAENAAEEPALDLPASPEPRSFDRAAILGAVGRAASAEASGADDAQAQRELDGRQFELRIRFGCKGPSSRLREEWLGWSFESETGTLRIRAKPTLGAGDELLSRLGRERFEVVEGFWIPRPWLLDPVCPAAASVHPAPATPAGVPAGLGQHTGSASTSVTEAVTAGAVEALPKWPRIGIAQFFTEEDARTERRATRPYDAVKTLDPKRPISSRGFNIVLSGRLKALPGGRVIACAATDAESPPECVVSADFDSVWIEDPDTRNVIAEWGRG